MGVSIFGIWVSSSLVGGIMNMVSAIISPMLFSHKISRASFMVQTLKRMWFVKTRRLTAAPPLGGKNRRMNVGGK